MGKPRCAGSNAKGEPCKAWPLSGSRFCAAHDRNLPDGHRFGSPEWSARAGASEKPRALKLTEELNRQVEEKAALIVDALFEALLADKGVTVGHGDDAFVEVVPDHAVRLRAIAELFDRAVGKPRQAIEHTGDNGGPIKTETDLSPDVAELLKQARDRIAAGRSAGAE